MQGIMILYLIGHEEIGVMLFQRDDKERCVVT